MQLWKSVFREVAQLIYCLQQDRMHVQLENIVFREKTTFKWKYLNKTLETSRSKNNFKVGTFW